MTQPVNKWARLPITVAAAILLLCSCTNRSAKLPPIATNTDNNAGSPPAIAELRRLYQAAQSEQERRAVCLRAIDEGLIYRDGPVSNLDQIFETHFASDRPAEGQVKKGMPVNFADQLSPIPRSDGQSEGVPFVGSYLGVEYDHAGKIRYYYLSNLHKGMSEPVVGRKAISVADLKQRYSSAKSESDRRDVALNAIDDGVIHTFAPVSLVDEIFGTQLASKLPDTNDKTLTGSVNFAGPGAGWFLAVEYSRKGDIYNYYLTNIPK